MKQVTTAKQGEGHLKHFLQPPIDRIKKAFGGQGRLAQERTFAYILDVHPIEPDVPLKITLDPKKDKMAVAYVGDLNSIRKLKELFEKINSARAKAYSIYPVTEAEKEAEKPLPPGLSKTERYWRAPQKIRALEMLQGPRNKWLEAHIDRELQDLKVEISAYDARMGERRSHTSLPLKNDAKYHYKPGDVIDMRTLKPVKLD